MILFSTGVLTDRRSPSSFLNTTLNTLNLTGWASSWVLILDRECNNGLTSTHSCPPPHPPPPPPHTHTRTPPPCDVMSLNGSQWPVVTTTLVFGFHWHCKHTASGTHYTHKGNLYLHVLNTEAVKSGACCWKFSPLSSSSPKPSWAGLPDSQFREDVSRLLLL